MGNKSCLCVGDVDDGDERESAGAGGRGGARGRQAPSMLKAPPDNAACLQAFITDIDKKLMSVPCVGGAAWEFRPGCNPKNSGMLSAKDVEALVARLGEANKVRRLELVSRGVDDTGACAIARWLGSAKASSLTYISLSHNNVTDVGATALGHALRENTALKHLRLDGNCFGADALANLGEALRANTGLQQLELCVGYGSLPLPAGAVKSLTNGLAGNASLKNLKITGENSRERRGAAVPCILAAADLGTAFAQLTENRVITDLAFTYLLGGGSGVHGQAAASVGGGDGAAAAQTSAAAGIRRCLAQCAALLIQNQTLTTVDFTGNLIGDDGGIAVADAMAQNATVTTLNLSRNALGNAAMKRLGAALGGNRRCRLTRLDLSDPFALRPMSEEWPKPAVPEHGPIPPLDKSKKAKKSAAAPVVDLTEGVVALCEGLEACHSLKTLLIMGIDLKAKSRDAMLRMAKGNPGLADVRFKTDGAEFPALSEALSRNMEQRTKEDLAEYTKQHPRNTLLDPPAHTARSPRQAMGGADRNGPSMRVEPLRDGGRASASPPADADAAPRRSPANKSPSGGQAGVTFAPAVEVANDAPVEEEYIDIEFNNDDAFD